MYTIHVEFFKAQPVNIEGAMDFSFDEKSLNVTTEEGAVVIPIQNIVLFTITKVQVKEDDGDGSDVKEKE